MEKIYNAGTERKEDTNEDDLRAQREAYLNRSYPTSDIMLLYTQPRDPQTKGQEYYLG